MKASIGQIAIVRSIFHGIPAKDDASSALQARDNFCNMDPAARAEIELRLRKVLVRSGRKIAENPAVESKTPAIIKELLSVGDVDFIGKSKELAQVLLEVQTRNNSSGMLFVAQCEISGSHAVLLVKVEQETGMLVEDPADSGGPQDVRYLQTLLLTSKSKVYKVALFDSADLEEDTLYGWAADVQMSGNEVAAFFLRKYLGCRLLDDPKQLTKLFHQHAQDWANKCVHNPNLRTQYQLAIATELLSQRDTISPRGFAASHLRIGDRDDFVNYLTDHDVPANTFDKEVSLVESQLNQLSVAFESGVLVMAPKSAFDSDVVTIEQIDGPLSRLVIQDVMGDVKGRGKSGGRPKSTETSDENPTEDGQE